MKAQIFLLPALLLFSPVSLCMQEILTILADKSTLRSDQLEAATPQPQEIEMKEIIPEVEPKQDEKNPDGGRVEHTVSDAKVPALQRWVPVRNKFLGKRIKAEGGAEKSPTVAVEKTPKSASGSKEACINDKIRSD